MGNLQASKNKDILDGELKDTISEGIKRERTRKILNSNQGRSLIHQIEPWVPRRTRRRGLKIPSVVIVRKKTIQRKAI